jgi:hypothetical protein
MHYHVTRAQIAKMGVIKDLKDKKVQVKTCTY